MDTLRRQRAMQFVLVRDHTGTVQVTHRRGGVHDRVEAELERLRFSATLPTGAG
ncbi:hypothetical protein ACH4OW_26645 [Streptomyces sp. NPDC017056]|uniref:hypothetical protein n=1 Tax=Streptomyces sp. NPDC017056 TaxID=3364973 RepID=UPI00378B0876